MKKETEEHDWDSDSKEQFLTYCEILGFQPTQEAARDYLYGDNGSMEEAEEPIPSWYKELPE